MPVTSMTQQLFWLLILAMPIAAVVRTVIFEEVFREPREWCIHQSKTCRRLLSRKFFYLFTCEYCFSHWVALAFVAGTGFRLLLGDWRGVVLAWLGLVLVTNVYLNLYARLRLEITSEKKQIEKEDKLIEKLDADLKESTH